MVIAQSHWVNTVDPVDMGFVPGVVGSSTRIANRTLVKTLVASGYSLKFSAGRYEWTGELDINGITDGVSNISIEGDGPATVLVQFESAVAQMLFFRNVDGVSIRNLRIEGPDFPTPVNIASNTRAGVAAYECSRVSIKDCEIVGIAGPAIVVAGCNGVTIADNTLYGNQGTELPSVSAIDIQIIRDTSFSKNITVTGNKCLSNNHQGISMTAISTNVVISDNVVVSHIGSDLAAEADTEATNQRKEGIVIVYDTDDTVANANQNEMTCTGNVVRNVRWNGIYCNSSNAFNSNEGGPRGVISGNQIRNVALSLSPTDQNGFQNGITVNQCRQLVIANNSISKINQAEVTREAHAGIHLALTQPATDGVPSEIILTGNHISDCEGYGVRIQGEIGPIVMTSNIIQECTERSLLISTANSTAASRTGEILIDGNRIESSVIKDANVMILIIAPRGETKFANNQCEISNAAWGTTNSEMIHFQLGLDGAFSGNTFRGPDASATRRCLKINNVDTDEIAGKLRIDGNQYDTWGLALFCTGAVPTAVVLESGNRYANVLSKRSGTVQIYTGKPLRDDNYTIDYKPTDPTDSADRPQVENFIAGDRANNVSRSPGTAKSWRFDGTSWMGESEEYVNADQFNIPTDTVTDAAPAVQDMIDFAVTNGIGRCIIPPRHYAWNTQVNLPNPSSGTAVVNRRLVLDGNGSVITVGAGITAIKRDYPDAGGTTNWNSWKPSIRNFVFKGVDQTASAIQIWQSVNAEILNIDMDNMDIGIELLGSYYCTVTNCNAIDVLRPYRVKGAFPEVLNSNINTANGNVNALHQCRCSLSDASAVGFLISNAANVLMSNCVGEGSSSAAVVKVENNLGSFKIQRNLRLVNFWLECAGGTGFDIEARESVFTWDGMFIFSTVQGKIIDASASDSCIFKIKDVSSFKLVEANPPSSMWFDNGATVGANKWIFEDNILPSGGSFADFNDAGVWESGLVPTDIVTRTYNP